MLCGNKPEETEFGTFWKSLISFYRGRVEIVIAKLKKHAWCKTAFRGSYSYKALVAYMDLDSSCNGSIGDKAELRER